MAGKPNGDFNSGKLGPLGSVSAEDKSDVFLVGLTTLAFFDPLGIGGEGCVVASIATEVAMGWVARVRVGRVSLLAYLDAIVATLWAFSDLFMEEAPPRVCTIFASLREKKTSKEKKNIERRTKMRLKWKSNVIWELVHN